MNHNQNQKKEEKKKKEIKEKGELTIVHKKNVDFISRTFLDAIDPSFSHLNYTIFDNILVEVPKPEVLKTGPMLAIISSSIGKKFRFKFFPYVLEESEFFVLHSYIEIVKALIKYERTFKAFTKKESKSTILQPKNLLTLTHEDDDSDDESDEGFDLCSIQRFGVKKNERMKDFKKRIKNIAKNFRFSFKKYKSERLALVPLVRFNFSKDQIKEIQSNSN